MADGGEVVSVGTHREAMPHRAVCRRLSSSSESGFHSDLSDEHNASPSDVTDAAVHPLNGLVWANGKMRACGDAGLHFRVRLVLGLAMVLGLAHFTFCHTNSPQAVCSEPDFSGQVQNADV